MPFNFRLFLKVFSKIDLICSVLLHICKPVLTQILLVWPTFFPKCCIILSTTPFLFCYRHLNWFINSKCYNWNGRFEIMKKMLEYYEATTLVAYFFVVTLLMASPFSYTKCGRYMPLKQVIIIWAFWFYFMLF